MPVWNRLGAVTRVVRAGQIRARPSEKLTRIDADLDKIKAALKEKKDVSRIREYVDELCEAKARALLVFGLLLVGARASCERDISGGLSCASALWALLSSLVVSAFCRIVWNARVSRTAHELSIDTIFFSMLLYLEVVAALYRKT